MQDNQNHILVWNSKFSSSLSQKCGNGNASKAGAFFYLTRYSRCSFMNLTYVSFHWNIFGIEEFEFRKLAVSYIAQLKYRLIFSSWMVREALIFDLHSPQGWAFPHLQGPECCWIRSDYDHCQVLGTWQLSILNQRTKELKNSNVTVYNKKMIDEAFWHA